MEKHFFQCLCPISKQWLICFALLCPLNVICLSMISEGYLQDRQQSNFLMFPVQKMKLFLSPMIPKICQEAQKDKERQDPHTLHCKLFDMWIRVSGQNHLVSDRLLDSVKYPCGFCGQATSQFNPSVENSSSLCSVA